MDIALRNFLELLLYLRTVLIQDMSLLFAITPSCPVFNIHPFNDTSFRAFANSAPANITHAEEEARMAMADVPVQLATGIQNALSGISVTHSEGVRGMDVKYANLELQVSEMHAMLAAIAFGASGGRALKKREYNFHVANFIS